jgi:hypothetical protein
MKFTVLIISILLVFFDCSNQNYQENATNEKSHDTFNHDFLSKKEIKDLVEIVSQDLLIENEKDSLVTLIIDMINYPLEFDSMHRTFNFHLAPNLKNPTPTIDNWNSYNGDKKTWEIVCIDLLLDEFRLIGHIDGFSGVVSTLQSSKHGNSINFESINFERYDFENPMKQLDSELRKSKRMIVTIDLSVLVIKIKDFERLKEIVARTKWKIITTYNK